MKIKVQKATLHDVKEIHALISKYAGKGFMLYRTIAEIEYKIRDYFVCKIDNKVIGCSALRVWNMKSSEIYALAVSSHFTGKQIGTRLVKVCIKEAKKLGVKNVITLTFKHEMFSKMGFEKATLRSLPRIMFTEKTVNVDKAYGLKL